MFTYCLLHAPRQENLVANSPLFESFPLDMVRTYQRIPILEQIFVDQIMFS